jgi:hypothetical protein
MESWLILLAIVVVVAVVIYTRRQSARDAEQRKIDETRRTQAQVAAADRAVMAASEPPAQSGIAPASGRGLLQEAADRAAGLPYERAVDQIEMQTSELARAREDAERAAARLSDRAEQALAAVQAAAAAHGGAVPGDGTHDCPPGYPIKGNMPSQLYHEPGQLSYNRTIPEVCFRNAEAAESAGFSPAHDDPGMRRGAMAAGAAVVEEIDLVAKRSEPETVIDEAVAVDAERGTVVAEEAAFTMDDVPPGAVRGDGSRDCPPTYPIKASARSRWYLAPGAPGYEGRTPELCFSSVESAEGAGFSPMA